MAKILVVDDERSIRELAAIVLKKEGHEIELCESGDIACIRLAQDNFDLVLTDLKCPESRAWRCSSRQRLPIAAPRSSS